ncbi:MAG: hypothetical protein IJR94_04320 [Synergistaceae bacterium]|nr:hypothetical protein [Synergistaceae bacterium]
MFLVILWLLQDFLTVFAGGGMQIPGLFMLGIIYRLICKDDSDGSLWAIWSAFAGGILWDLRWVGIPGFFTLGNVIVVMLVIKVWGSIPPQGRVSGTGLLIFILMEVSQLVPPLIPIIILGGDTGWTFFFLQQIYSLPAILLTLRVVLKKLKEKAI